MKYFNFSYYLTAYDFGWVSFLDYFSRLYIASHVLFEKYREFVKANIFSLILFKQIVILSRPPVRCIIERERLHCLFDAALRFVSGYAVYAVRGVRFSVADFEKFFIRRDFGLTDVLKIQNVEQRAIILTYCCSFPDLLKRKYIKHISIDNQNNAILYCLHLKDLDFGVLELRDFSRHDIIYYLCVPARFRNVRRALAWSFYQKARDYQLEAQT